MTDATQPLLPKKPTIRLLHVDDRQVFVHWIPLTKEATHRIIRLNPDFEVHCNHLSCDEAVICGQIKKLIRDEKDE
jgi:hypothetical protein